jgi:hypothetical protein
VTVPTRPSAEDYEAACRRNVENAREGIKTTDCRTRAMNSHLVDLGMFDRDIQLGQRVTFAGQLDTALSLSGLEDLTCDRESVDDVRRALKAYGEFLITVANNAF